MPCSFASLQSKGIEKVVIFARQAGTAPSAASACAGQPPINAAQR
jgi:hypothetical protein